MSKEQVIELLRQYREQHRLDFGINEMGIFGSYAKGTNKKDSDLDVFVDIDKPNLFLLADIKSDLEEQLNVRVDLVRKRANMNQYLKKHIEEDAIYV